MNPGFYKRRENMNEDSSTKLYGHVNALRAVSDERIRQDALMKSGKILWTCADVTRSNEEKLAVLAEEFGEVAKEVVEGIIKAGKLEKTFPVLNASALLSELHSNVNENLRKELHSSVNENLRKELIQVAAMCVAWVEAIDARGETK
jgi:NTP pyrophosphatase (non-canonical NTP hydrolase)